MAQPPSGWITIDPGADGAAVIWELEKPVAYTFFHHTQRNDYAAMLYDFIRQYGTGKIEVAFLERIYTPYKGTINEGVKLGCLQILGIPTYRLSSQTWQAYRNRQIDGTDWRSVDNAYKYPTKGKAKSVWLAMDRYPDISLLRTSRCETPHDGLAEALCMGMWVIDRLSRDEIELPAFDPTLHQGVLFDE